ncbi:hypothetical protein IJ098_00510 [Candidatus Saccharibacteria bacterium]|nr:hypothetical protein [Candidatus Saccharibacteria bacterium]MBQ8984327.1 hypothetical protein [Candidatus Saccharibacteria bacterium]
MKFEKEIKYIEDEILNLKTASEYVSVKSLTSTVIDGVYTGMYQVNYAGNNESIISLVGCGELIAPSREDFLLGLAYPRTPIGNTQIIEINTDYTNFDTQQIETGTCSMIVNSNTPVISITRIS